MSSVIDLLAQPGLTTAVVALILSLMVGSFLNVVIYRLPVMMEREWQAQLAEDDQTEQAGEPFNLAVPASRCGNCGHLIRWYENIPLLSYLALRGRCSGCGTSISLRYPAVELLTGILGGFIGWQLGLDLAGAGLLTLTWVLIALTFIDIDHQLLPDRLTLPLLWLGLLFNTQGTFTSIEHAVYGAAAGYLVLWSVYWIFKLLTGKEGMGYGDFKLLAAIGAWGGFEVLPLTILLSSVVGVALALTLMAAKRHQAANPLPFGPYLAIAGWIALIWGTRINEWYLGMLLV
ncbi:type 4 prepilin-like proteins leader peptide-processing enzyme [Marinobacterium zhoushanense]|uniref:Prepilin leader peptidase/N-methyltransferase n=1 Tax=Marinobacterium zhoushanense TaxID=1679163 RepID=A0ABQ1K8A4_9GAMM|nr:A24 family peptidase [Marinobacterium zhoushanense]GGB87570.1 type 4 prepilin-like proteins leader peptide-processing enzyme [Marinobacterium zhoushanense]